MTTTTLLEDDRLVMGAIFPLFGETVQHRYTRNRSQDQNPGEALANSLPPCFVDDLDTREPELMAQLRAASAADFAPVFAVLRVADELLPAAR